MTTGVDTLPPGIKRAAHQAPADSYLFYQAHGTRPFIDRAEGIWMHGQDGKTYMDAASGAMVCNVGHSNPRVLKAMREQMERATFAYRLQFQSEAAEGLAAEIVDLMPAGLDRVFFVSGGSEAVESCLKFARQYMIATGQGTRYKVISRHPSYHGSTLGALAVTGYTPLSAPFDPMMRPMPKIATPRHYLDGGTEDEDAYALRHADMLEEAILREGPDTVMAFIVEPVGGASTGAVVPGAPYHARIREICDKYGILLIHDEVMTGVGRTGAFLASEHWKVVPDLIAMSKGFAAGYAPLGAMIAPSRMVAKVLDAGGYAHGHTYAGNPIACAAGRAVVREVVERDLSANARIMGARQMAGLRALKEEFPFIGDVRGLGLLQAVEFVADRETMRVLPPELNAAARLVEIAYEKGLIVYFRRTRGGQSGDHIMVTPPLTITDKEVDTLLERLRDSLVALRKELAGRY
ncbi:Adenosylmethionine-8-amino-7-oxononanoate aminotransferase [Caenispirillum salinarum AK4]|uniref:Adenosylmethionine-8-amino-7-oxononanoate aminotransferase n=1 Tax=Caenispirillum salinarum AK4 TaxID=1238182 RepID=K9GZ04_9PROT|nr:aspartate aminotransferase family protein [Caenispirillum salinarum]EKV30019.1 Adenosylmethionine-8-amino-7-oxononanoate aminotransferase [Caenispirillum salinarum AK4]